MPRLSDTMEEGVIVEWLKKEGDQVELGIDGLGVAKQTIIAYVPPAP